ncbi:MAG TPA: hypothetical protein VJX91_09490, partial [Candidatus Eisenbacteria bacterium]|nr:hypothetical protein [Candidatus Eisenbacteria bacterium]
MKWKRVDPVLAVAVAAAVLTGTAVCEATDPTPGETKVQAAPAKTAAAPAPSSKIRIYSVERK